MIDVDAATTGWDGDLRNLTMQAWAEDSDIVAMVAVGDGGIAAGWLNLKHVHGDVDRLVWMWIRHAAVFRPPVDVMHVSDLARLRAGGDQQSYRA